MLDDQQGDAPLSRIRLITATTSSISTATSRP
jgi:hypothetical protein